MIVRQAPVPRGPAGDEVRTFASRDPAGASRAPAGDGYGPCPWVKAQHHDAGRLDRREEDGCGVADDRGVRPGRAVVAEGAAALRRARITPTGRGGRGVGVPLL